MGELKLMQGSEGNTDYVVVRDDGKYQLGYKAWMTILPPGIAVAGLRIRGAMKPMDGATVKDMSKGEKLKTAFGSVLATQWEKWDENRVSFNLTAPVIIEPGKKGQLPEKTREIIQKFLDALREKAGVDIEDEAQVKEFLFSQTDQTSAEILEAVGINAKTGMPKGKLADVLDFSNQDPDKTKH